MNFKRITLFAGHYGSGKTNVAVNYAVKLSKQDKKPIIYDMDIVNPYFRTVDAQSLLTNEGVELIVSPYAETNVDIPAMNAAAYKMVDDLTRYAVVDVGGDDRGALALGRFSKKILTENNYDMLLVVNVYRPETRTVKDILTIVSEIEGACKMKFTGIVNNSNLGAQTTEEDVFKSVPIINEVSKELNVPIKFTSVKNGLSVDSAKLSSEIFNLDLIKYGEWQ